jgi:hypothetical protein
MCTLSVHTVPSLSSTVSVSFALSAPFSFSHYSITVYCTELRSVDGWTYNFVVCVTEIFILKFEVAELVKWEVACSYLQLSTKE